MRSTCVWSAPTATRASPAPSPPTPSAVSGDTLQITYRATTDAPTVVNMTNHGYWNLDGVMTVRDHHIQLAADRVLPVDGDGIPTGSLAAVGDTPFDLRERTELGPAMDAAGGGFDHCFSVPGAPATPAPAAAALRPAAVLDAPATGRWMSVATDQPGVQLYTGESLGSRSTATARSLET